MIPSKQHAQEKMRRDLYAAIRRNRSWQGGSFSRYEVVEVLANVLSGQIDVIRDDARKQRND